MSPFEVVNTISATHLAAVPYLKCSPGDRVIPLQAYWDGAEWHIWIPDPKGGLVKMRPLDCAEGLYVASQPARETDLFLPFLDFMWKHASWPEVTRWVSAIESDVVKLAAAVAKIDHFTECPELAGRHQAHVFVATDIEYIFIRCRSLFDNLQHVVSALWDRIVMVDAEAAKRKRKLPPDSFRKLAQKVRDRKPGEPPPFGLADAILGAYERVQPFFFSLRGLRDQLMHRGGDIGRIFVTDRGCAIDARGRLAGIAPSSVPKHAFNDALVALRPAIAHVLCSTIYALNEFVDAFVSVIKFPESLIPEHAVFLRAPHAPALVAAQEVLRGASPWRDVPPSSVGKGNPDDQG